MRTVKYEKKEITPLTDEEDNSKRIMKSKKFATYVKKNLILMMIMMMMIMMMTIKSIIHRHYTGKIRGAAHNICNLRYKTTTKNYCSISQWFYI